MRKNKSISFYFLAPIFLIVIFFTVYFVRNNNDLRSKAATTNQNLSMYDVIIAGGGSSGIGAAIQAYRLGATVAIIEETDWLGGQITSANVSTMDEGPQDDQYGIYKEFINKTKSIYGARPVSTCYGGGPEANCFEPHKAKQAINQLIEEVKAERYGVLDIYYRTRVSEIIITNNNVTGVLLSNGSTKQTKVLIDATEFGDVIPKTGLKYRLGNRIYQNGIAIGSSAITTNPKSCIQDITYTAVIRKYGAPTQTQLSEMPIIPKPPEYGINGEPQLEFSRQVSLTPVQPFPWSFEKHNSYRGLPDSLNSTYYRPPNNPLDYSSITKTAVNFANDYSMYATYNPIVQDKVLGHPNVFVEPVNNQTISLEFVENQQTRQNIICTAKKKTWSFIYYIQNDLGYRDWSLAKEENFCSNDSCYVLQETNCSDIPDSIERYMPSHVYTRESRRIIGRQTLTAKDITDSNRNTNKFVSSVAVGSYPTDLHNCMWDPYLETSLESMDDLSTSGNFQVPYETLFPEDIGGFLAIEKNISQTRLVNGATRLQPITMNTGQAAGVASAISAKHNLKISEISPRLIQAVLAINGARLSAITIRDVPFQSQYYPAAEFTLASKIIVGDGKGNVFFDRFINRGEVGAILLRVKNIQATSRTQRFTDVPPTHQFFQALNTLFEKGLTAGCYATGPQYCPDRILNREELAIFLTRLDPLENPMILPTLTQSSFTDVPLSKPAARQIHAVFQEGIMPSCTTDNRQFCPEKQVTRGEFADSLMRYFVYRANKKPRL